MRCATEDFWLTLVPSPLQAKHAAGEHQFGVDGETGKVVDMKDYGLYESAAVKVQTLKTAIEVRCSASFLCEPLANFVVRFAIALSTVCMPASPC